MRNFMALLIAPLLRLSGYRFSKSYRWGTTPLHRLVYAMVNTIRANNLADSMERLT
jgi:hypothetical protein